MCNKRNSSYIDIKVTDVVLTPLTCAVLVNEIIKFLVYQKSQIPYPYNWLQAVVTRKRKSMELKNTKNVNLSVERHYNIVSSAYDAVEDIMENIKAEFKSVAKFVKEILIIFGTTPFTPKEVFRINIPLIAENHIEANHSKSTHKVQQKILRNIFLSQDWLNAMDHSYPTTNMYVMLRKSKSEVIKEDSFFMPIGNYNIPTNSACVTVNLDYQNESDYICCSNLLVYSDTKSHKTIDDNKKESNNLEDCWYQAKLYLRGYKDCFINKVSATELF